MGRGFIKWEGENDEPKINKGHRQEKEEIDKQERRWEKVFIAFLGKIILSHLLFSKVFLTRADIVLHFQPNGIKRNSIDPIIVCLDRSLKSRQWFSLLMDKKGTEKLSEWKCNRSVGNLLLMLLLLEEPFKEAPLVHLLNNLEYYPADQGSINCGPLLTQCGHWKPF